MSARIGGFFLVIACIIMPITIFDYVSSVAEFPGNDASPVREKGEYAQSVYERRATGWIFEVIAMALFASAAFVLSERRSRAGWALAGVGALFTAPMYAILRGGTGMIFQQETLDVELFLAINEIAAETFFIGQGLMMLGLGLAHFLELDEPSRPLPRWLLILGGAIATFSGAVFTLFQLDFVGTYMLAGLSQLLGVFVTVILGIGLIQQTPTQPTG